MDNIRDYINEENVIKDEIYQTLENSVTCSICSDILIEPKMCMNCQNVYCEQCINDWAKKSNTCPNRCQNTKFNKSLGISELLSKLKFICSKCDAVINYDDMKKHSLINCKNKINIEKVNKNNIKEKPTNTINSKSYYITQIIYSYNIGLYWGWKNYFDIYVRNNNYFI